MKKILFASAFALMGTFAMANETNPTKENAEKQTEEIKLEIICMPIQLSCTEDCYNYDNTHAPTIDQFFDEVEAQEAYVCGG